MDREISSPSDIERWYSNEIIEITKKNLSQYKENLIAANKERIFLYKLITGADEPDNTEVIYEYKGS